MFTKQIKHTVTAVLFAAVVAVVAPSNAVALELIYCLAPNGLVTAMSKSYASNCESGLAPAGAKEISESRAKELFAEERRRALSKEPLPQTLGSEPVSNTNQK